MHASMRTYIYIHVAAILRKCQGQCLQAERAVPGTTRNSPTNQIRYGLRHCVRCMSHSSRSSEPDQPCILDPV